MRLKSSGKILKRFQTSQRARNKLIDFLKIQDIDRASNLICINSYKIFMIFWFWNSSFAVFSHVSKTIYNILYFEKKPKKRHLDILEEIMNSIHSIHYSWSRYNMLQDSDT